MTGCQTFRLYHNSKKNLISACHAGLDPASSIVTLWKSNGFPFDFAQGGEPVEPRVRPGMTISSFWCKNFRSCSSIIKKGRDCFSPAFFWGNYYWGRKVQKKDLHPFPHLSTMFRSILITTADFLPTPTFYFLNCRSPVLPPFSPQWKCLSPLKAR